MINIQSYDSFKAVNESMMLLSESTIDVFKNLINNNPDLMRQVFNCIASKQMKLTPTTPYQELSAKDAFKVKDDTSLKIWSKGGVVQIITIGNDVMDRYFTKTGKKLSPRMRQYFYMKSFFGSKEAFDYIQANGDKIKNFLMECDNVLIFNINDLKSGKILKDEEILANDIEKFANKYDIPVFDSMQGKNEDMREVDFVNLPEPAFLYNKGYMWPKDNRSIIKSGPPSTEDISEKDVITLMRTFIQRLPISRGSAKVEKITSGGVKQYKMQISYTTLVPNPALIQSLLDKSGLVPTGDTFYSEYFTSLQFSCAPSQKAAQMATSDWWTAFVNNHKNDAFKRALSTASSAVKSKAREVGDKQLLMAKDGLTDRPDFQQFFTDILMYYTKSEDLPGEKLNPFEPNESKIIFR